MITVAITGRSGCGKSSVTALLRQKGFSVIDGDALSREILLPGSPCLPKLQAAFGADILQADGTLNRRLLADRAFATPEGTKTLNEITHPEIYRRMEKNRKKAEEAGETLYFIDGAVILGTPFEKLCQKIVLVSASLEISVQRICARDGISPQMARRRLDAQPPLSWLEQRSDYILQNDTTLEALAVKVQQLLESLEGEKT